MLAALPARFRRGCHWLLYAESIVGPEGIPNVQVTPGAPMAQRLAEQQRLGPILATRTLLFPEGD